MTFKKSNLSQGQILAIFAACFELCSFLWPMLPMIKLVKNYKLSLYFQTSGVILPRKYSLIKVFEKRFLYNRGDLRAQDALLPFASYQNNNLPSDLFLY